MRRWLLVCAVRVAFDWLLLGDRAGRCCCIANVVVAYPSDHSLERRRPQLAGNRNDRATHASTKSDRRPAILTNPFLPPQPHRRRSAGCTDQAWREGPSSSSSSPDIPTPFQRETAQQAAGEEEAMAPPPRGPPSHHQEQEQEHATSTTKASAMSGAIAGGACRSLRAFFDLCAPILDTLPTHTHTHIHTHRHVPAADRAVRRHQDPLPAAGGVDRQGHRAPTPGVRVGVGCPAQSRQGGGLAGPVAVRACDDESRRSRPT